MCRTSRAKCGPWSWATYPRTAAFVLYFLCLGLIVRGLRGQSRLLMFCAGVALGLTIATHPVTGVMSSLVVGGVLGVGAVEGARRGLGRSFLTLLAWLGSGAVLVASPWIIDTFLAWQVKGNTPPIHFKWNDRLTALLVLEFGDFSMLRRVLARLGPFWSVVVWLGPVTAGSIRLLKRPRDPLLLAYICTAIIVPMLTIYSPLTPILMRVVGAAYVSRFVEVLPLAALAGLGFGALRTVMVPRVVLRVSIGTAVMLAVATMLHGLEPWRKPRLVIPRHLIHRPDLASLEPIIGG